MCRVHCPLYLHLIGQVHTIRFTRTDTTGAGLPNLDGTDVEARFVDSHTLSQPFHRTLAAQPGHLGVMVLRGVLFKLVRSIHCQGSLDVCCTQIVDTTLRFIYPVLVSPYSLLWHLWHLLPVIAADLFTANDGTCWKPYKDITLVFLYFYGSSASRIIPKGAFFAFSFVRSSRSLDHVIVSHDVFFVEFSGM